MVAFDTANGGYTPISPAYAPNRPANEPNLPPVGKAGVAIKVDYTTPHGVLTNVVELSCSPYLLDQMKTDAESVEQKVAELATFAEQPDQILLPFYPLEESQVFRIWQNTWGSWGGKVETHRGLFRRRCRSICWLVFLNGSLGLLGYWLSSLLGRLLDGL